MIRQVTETLAKISANANELLGVALPDELFYYISGIDLENPCLYFLGGQDSVIAFVGLDNFLGAGYPGYNATGIPESIDGAARIGRELYQCLGRRTHFAKF